MDSTLSSDSVISNVTKIHSITSNEISLLNAKYIRRVNLNFCLVLCLNFSFWLMIGWRDLAFFFFFPLSCSVMSDSLIQDYIAARLVLPNRITVPLKKNMSIAQLRFPVPHVSFSFFIKDVILPERAFVVEQMHVHPCVGLLRSQFPAAVSAWIVGFL